MYSVKIDVFFSCSFAEADKDVNEYFHSICKALDMQCMNVSTAYAETPPEVAKAQIGGSQALIAVCVKRGDLGGGNFTMPDAVHDELSFAFGKDVPVLMIVEDGVQLGGFKNNFGTHLRFKRGELFSKDFIEKAIAAIHGLKMKVLSPCDLSFDQDINESYADYLYHLVELKELGGTYTWTYATSKKLIFNRPYKRSFITGAWAVLPQNLTEEAEPISWDLVVDGASRGITIKSHIAKQTSECVEAVLKLDPPAEEGDFIEYSTTSSSPYLNPIWLEDTNENLCIHLDSESFKCADGMIPIQRTKKAVFEFRFPKSYGMKKHDIRPFVASYTSGVDYEVASELKRLNVEIDAFAGNLVVRMEIESPLLRHMYGIAWNPKPMPSERLRLQAGKRMHAVLQSAAG